MGTCWLPVTLFGPRAGEPIVSPRLLLLLLLLLMSSSRTSKASEEPTSGNEVEEGKSEDEGQQAAKSGRAVTIWGLRTKCPMAFEEVGGRCYFYGHFPLNWYRAMEFCHSFGQGVSLAVIETSRENFFVRQFLKVHGNEHSGVWVGGTDNGHDGQWAWFPTGQLVQFTGWGPSQPSGGDQHCMYLVGGHLSYQWADFHCLFDMNFLCEYSVNDVTPW